MNKIKRVLIVGGTHGNELIGVYLVKKFERQLELVTRPSFETLTLIGNPKAVAAGIRYIDQDLNRSFEPTTLAAATGQAYEIQRAKAVRAWFEQSSRQPVDFILDQHGTTSNAGLMLILDNTDPFTLQLAAYLSSIQPQLKVYSSANSGRNQDSLRSVAPHRVGIEVGPVAHGTLHADLFQKTEKLIHDILDYVEHYNSAPATFETTSLTVYQYTGAIDYPKDKSGEIRAMIHPQLQFQDYQPLNPGDPLFLTFDGETLVYQGDATVYPVFINEAAYYEKGIALCLTQPRLVSCTYPAFAQPSPAHSNSR